VNRVSPGILLIGFFGVLTGLAVIYGLKRSWEQQKPVSVVAKPPMRSVLLASSDLPEGRAIRNSDFFTLSLTNEQFAKREWPVLMMANGKQLLNRILQKPIKKGQAFEIDAFYPEGTGPNVADRLQPGLRAVSLDVSTSGVPNQAVPGNFVDVIFRSDPTKDQTIPEVTRTLFTGVEILGIGDNSTIGLRPTLDRKADFQTVILAVSAEQAMRLKATEGHGILSLTLRQESELDKPNLSVGSLSLAEVLDLPPPPEPLPPVVEPMPMTTEFYRRGKRQVNTFSPDGLTVIAPVRARANQPKADLNVPSNTQKVPPYDVPKDDLPKSIETRDGQDQNNDRKMEFEKSPRPTEPNRNRQPNSLTKQSINQTAYQNSF